MASNHGHSGSGGAGRDSARQRPPEWADGLKQLYDQVVEEALPDAFKDLLDRLDSIDPARGRRSGDEGASGDGSGGAR